MNTDANENGIIVKVGYISRKIPTPNEFYSARTFYTLMYLTKGINLWYSNPIKSELIPKFNLNNESLSDNARFNGLIDAETGKILSELTDYVFSHYKGYYDTFNLLMAIAVERVLKGLTLHNGYIIHQNKRSKRAIRIEDITPANYKALQNKVYSLDNFTKFDILKHAIFWEPDKSLVDTLKVIEHLKTIRDLEAHTAQYIDMLFQLTDIVAIIKVDEIMDKALKIHRFVNRELENQRQNHKSKQPCSINIGKSAIFNTNNDGIRGNQEEDILRLLDNSDDSEK